MHDPEAVLGAWPWAATLLMCAGRGGRRGTIVIVDDEPAVRSLLEDVLVSAGHTVVTADSVAEGVKACAVARPDVVLIDMVMPHMNGLALIRSLRAATPAPRIIAMSGGGTSEEGFDLLAKAREQGADVTLTKPMSIAAVLRIVDQLLVTGAAGRPPIA